MWKKLAATCLIFIAIISYGNFSNATSITPKSDTMDTSKYEILNLEKTSFSTRNKVILINGKAPTGTEILINVFGTTDLTKKKFNLDKLPESQDYIERMTESAKSGNMGFFQKELDLILGINKVIITFNEGDLKPIELIIYSYENSDSNMPGNREIRFSNIRPLATQTK